MKNAKLSMFIFALVSFVSVFSSSAPRVRPEGMSRAEWARINRAKPEDDNRLAGSTMPIWTNEEFLRRENEARVKEILAESKLFREKREREERESGLKAIDANKRDTELKNPVLAPDGSKDIEPFGTLPRADTQAASSSTASTAVTASVVDEKLSGADEVVFPEDIFPEVVATPEASGQLSQQDEVSLRLMLKYNDEFRREYDQAIRSATTQEEKNEVALKLIAVYKVREEERKKRYNALQIDELIE